MNFTLEIEQQLRALIDPGAEARLRAETRANSLALEIGCGPGQYRYIVNGDYFGVDITADDYRHDLPRTPDVLADAMRLPFRSAVFDLVFYSNIFYMLPASNAALLEGLRVLRPGGRLILFDYSLTTLKRLASNHAANGDFVSIHVRSCTDWIDLLRSTGLLGPQLEAKSIALRHQILRMLNIPGLRRIYQAVLDSRESALVISGTKPAANVAH